MGISKIGDLLIDTETATAFAEWLHELVQERRKAIASTEAMAEKDKIEDERYNKMTKLAAQWARKNGVIEGMPAAFMAAATWEAFISSEGWFSPLDVDDHFEPRGNADYQDEWESAYIAELHQMEWERKQATK